MLGLSKEMGIPVVMKFFGVVINVVLPIHSLSLIFLPCVLCISVRL